MPTLTKGQRVQLVERLASPFGDVRLICDGHRVSLQVQRLSRTALKYGVMTYVDGRFEGKWLSDKDAPERKFLRRRERFIYSAKTRSEIARKCSKRLLKEYWPNLNEKIEFFDPVWSSGKAAIDHLCRVCESVEIAPDETGDA